MSYKGRFIPKNYPKYKGDPTNIVFRSLLERKFMIYCDTNQSILQWSSEEIIIPYVSPVDNRWHRYFPDFYIKYRDRENNIRESLIEVKPYSQISSPKIKMSARGKPTSRFLREAVTWEVNQAKWKAAIEYCLDRKWEFKLMTEKELR
jgi:hypothetical protein